VSKPKSRHPRVFVRALDEAGRWGSFDAMDLDDDSFRRFILERLSAVSILVALHEEGEPPPLRVKAGVRRGGG